MAAVCVAGAVQEVKQGGVVDSADVVEGNLFFVNWHSVMLAAIVRKGKYEIVCMKSLLRQWSLL
jgi:hypothetical protein